MEVTPGLLRLWASPQPRGPLLFRPSASLRLAVLSYSSIIPDSLWFVKAQVWWLSHSIYEMVICFPARYGQAIVPLSGTATSNPSSLVPGISLSGHPRSVAPSYTACNIHPTLSPKPYTNANQCWESGHLFQAASKTPHPLPYLSLRAELISGHHSILHHPHPTQLAL